MTHLINHTFIQAEFSIAISPDHSGKVRNKRCVALVSSLLNAPHHKSTLCSHRMKTCFLFSACSLFLLFFLQVILTGDVSEVGGFRLFRSQDFGLTFVATDLPFEPLIQMLYNPRDSNVLLSLSITVAAFIFLKLNPATKPDLFKLFDFDRRTID